MPFPSRPRTRRARPQLHEPRSPARSSLHASSQRRGRFPHHVRALRRRIRPPPSSPARHLHRCIPEPLRRRTVHRATFYKLYGTWSEEETAVHVKLGHADAAPCTSPNTDAGHLFLVVSPSTSGDVRYSEPVFPIANNPTVSSPLHLLPRVVTFLCTHAPRTPEHRRVQRFPPSLQLVSGNSRMSSTFPLHRRIPSSSPRPETVTGAPMTSPRRRVPTADVRAR